VPLAMETTDKAVWNGRPNIPVAVIGSVPNRYAVLHPGEGIPIELGLGNTATGQRPLW